MRKQHGRWWCLTSFFAAFVSQQPMLVGLTLPLWAVHFGADTTGEWGVIDMCANFLCIIGIVVAYVADTELREFMELNAHLASRKKPKMVLLDEGLWGLCRHPNYLGEQLWWWSMGLFGVACGEPWTLVGAAFNSLVMAEVTVLTESRMTTTGSKERQAAYRDYADNTPVLVPWGFFFRRNRTVHMD
jgi:steroid 5-alpha reductase family enzyme